MEIFATLAAPVTARVEVKKSLFIGVVAPAASVADADALFAQVRKKHYSARHHCTAMIIGDAAQVQHSNDDGEPSGSAGAPMLAVLRHHKLTDAAAIVTRYFGGTLLGVGGLVRAYTDTVTQALAQGAIINYSPATSYALACGYQIFGDFEQILRTWISSHHAKLVGIGYEPEPTFEVLIANRALADFTAMLAPWAARSLQVTELGASKIQN
jgi:uncharacterized YigZ family protein